MDLEILRQVADIKDSMATMQDNIKLSQADMNRRFESLQNSIYRRLDALQAPVKRHVDMFDNEIGPLIQRLVGFTETIDQRFNTLNHDLWPRFNGIDTSVEGLNQFTKQQSESMTELLQNLNQRSMDQVRNNDQRSQDFRHRIEELVRDTSDTLSNHSDTATSKLEECVKKTSDTLNHRFDTATTNLEDRIRAVDEKSANLKSCFDNARLATLNEDVQHLWTDMHGLKIEMQAG